MNKGQIAKHFDVSTTTIGNWLNRGMPYTSAPEGKGRGGYVFNLGDVQRWRDELQQAECTQPEPGDPDFLQKRPDHLNQLRYHSERAADHFLWHFINHDEGVRLLLAMLRDAGCSHEKAYSELQTFVFAMYTCFSDWVAGDEYFKTFEDQGMSADSLWRNLTGEEIRTRPPIDPDKIKFELPDWVVLNPEEYVKEYWPEK